MLFSIIRSSDKATGTNGDCVLNINEKISGYYGLYSFTFTNSLYNVTSTNNRLIIADTSDVVLSDVTIPEGYYTGSELADYVTTQLSGLTVTFDNKTNKFTFTYLSNFKLLFTSYDNTSHFLLGFEKSNYQSSSSVLSSINAADLVSCKDLFVTIREANKQVSNNSSNSHNDYSLIINDNTSSFGSLFRYKQEDIVKQQSIKITPTRQLKIQIYDDEHNIVNTNNWIMILQKK